MQWLYFIKYYYLARAERGYYYNITSRPGSYYPHLMQSMMMIVDVWCAVVAQTQVRRVCPTFLKSGNNKLNQQEIIHLTHCCILMW